MKISLLRNRIDVEKVLRMRKEEDLSIAAIARRLGFHESSVRNALHRAGVKLRPKRRRASVPHRRRLYSLWARLRRRCSKPEQPQYANYGGRGLTVCAAWLDFWAFYDWAMQSGYRVGYSAEIVGRAKEFSPRTCRWITAKERYRRAGTQPVYPITAFGETKSAGQWERDPRCAVTRRIIFMRVRRGFSPETAISAEPATLPRRTSRRKAKSRRRPRRALRRRVRGVPKAR